MSSATLSVFFVRHGLDNEEQGRIQGKPPPSKDLPNMNSLYQPSPEMIQGLAARLDPDLTESGYKQAEDAFRAIANAFRTMNQERKLAYVAAPYRRCAASALMISTAGFEPEEWSVWGLTTPPTQTSPTAIPILIENSLADCTKETRQLGGMQVVLDAGLLYCAAMPWNKAYKKDPLMGEIQKMKDVVQPRVKEWQAAGTQDKPNFGADVQYLKFDPEQPDHPYKLQHASLKFNIVTDHIKPNKYLPPARKGMYYEKPPPIPDPVHLQGLSHVICTARKAGCDTVICVCPPELIRDVLQASGSPADFLPSPATIASFQVVVSGDTIQSWQHHTMCDGTLFSTANIPPFRGPNEPTVAMDPEYAKQMETAGDEKWGNFPPPEPENIPPDYPKDIPAFGMCLEEPDPTGKPWAYQNRPDPSLFM